MCEWAAKVLIDGLTVRMSQAENRELHDRAPAKSTQETALDCLPEKRARKQTPAQHNITGHKHKQARVSPTSAYV